jgi:hypothetical protein
VHLFGPIILRIDKEISSQKDRFCKENVIKAYLNVWKAIDVFRLYCDCKHYVVEQNCEARIYQEM